MRTWLVLVAMLQAGRTLLTGDGRQLLHQGSDDGGPSDGPSTGPSGVTGVLARSTFPGAITVDATHVYWVDRPLDYVGGAVMKVPRAGGTAVTLASGSADSYGIAVDATYVYWANQAGIIGTVGVWRVPKAGGEPVKIVDDGVLGLAIDATHVYWTAGADNGVRVMQMPLDGGPAVTLASGQACPRGLAVDTANVYWTTCEPGDDIYPVFGKVMKAPLAGGGPVVLAEHQLEPYAIAVDATHVYWTNTELTNYTDFPTTTVNRVPISGGAPVTIVYNGDSVPVTIAVDSTYVYWGSLLSYGETQPAGALRKVPLAGGDVVELATGLQCPWVLTVDDTTLFWADGMDGTINAMPK